MNFSKLSFDNKPKLITQQFLAQNQDILAELVTFIDFAEGFTLGFIEINFLPDIDTLINTLETHPDCEEIQFEVIDFSNYTDLRFIRDEIIKLLPNIQHNSNKKLVLIIRGLAKSIGVFGEYPPILQDLNFVRDAYKNSVPYPILFIFPDYAITRIAKFAPDFWAWKSGVFRFKTSENTREEALLQIIDSDNPVGSSVKPESQERIDLLERLLMEYRPSGQPCPPENMSACITILQQLGKAYLSRYKAAKAQEYLEEALKLAKQQNDRFLIEEVYCNLGRAYDKQQKFDEAVQYYQKALNIWEDAGNLYITAFVYDQLGIIAQKQRNFDKAQQYYQKALKIKEDAGDFDNAADDYLQLGIVAFEQRNFEEVVQYCQKALNIYEDAEDFHKVALIYHQLGMVAQEQRNFDEAVQYYQKALNIYEDAEDFHKVALIYHQLGNITFLQKQFEESQQYYQKALNIYEDVEDFHKVALIYHNLGMVTFRQRYLDEAVQYFQKALNIFEEVEDFEKVANVYYHLGNTTFMQQKFDEAVQYFQKALNIFEEIEDFYKTADVYSSLGFTAQEEQQYQEAIQYHQKALTIFIQAEDFYKAGYLMRQLGKILQALGEDQFKIVWKEAIGKEISQELYSEILNLVKNKELGESKSNILQSFFSKILGIFRP